MTDVQTAAPAPLPSVFDATPTVSAAAGTLLLTRPTGGTALHVMTDAEYILHTRSLIGTCTREEWDRPAHRRLAIARAWESAIAAIRSEDEEFVSFAPVTLYRDVLGGEVRFADISLPGHPQKLITANGSRVVAAPADLTFGYLVERTTYARWAEGPLPHVDLDMQTVRTPDDDRDIQYLRHLNGDMRELIDGALGPAEWALQANTHRTDHGLVDYRMRGVFRRLELRRVQSKQTGDISGLVIDGKLVNENDFDPSTTEGLDAILEAD